jgi:hypothetical protein
MMMTTTMSDCASRAAAASGTSAAQKRTISTPSDHAATAGAASRERRPAGPAGATSRRPAGPAGTGDCTSAGCVSPTERNATPGPSRKRYGSVPEACGPATEILAKLDGQCAAEYKYDGVRVQPHRTADGAFEQAVTDGCEGLVCKAVGPGAVYQAGARGWLAELYRGAQRAPASS